jgi:hypothetical protein
MPRDLSIIDYTEEISVPDVAASFQTGPVTVLKRVVPSGLGWHIDNFYFFARAMGGWYDPDGGGGVIVGPEALQAYFLFQVFTSSSQLNYEAYPETQPVVVQKTTMPFLNDRIGPREAKFGITLFEGERIQATVRVRGLPNFQPSPALLAIGFRIMGIEAPKADVEDYLRLKKWDR